MAPRVSLRPANRIDLFWPEVEPEAGRASLRQALSLLRRQVEPAGARAGAVIVADRTICQRPNPPGIGALQIAV